MRLVATHDPEVVRIDDDSILHRLTGLFAIVIGLTRPQAALLAKAVSDFIGVPLDS